MRHPGPAEALRDSLAPMRLARVGVAVSGGGDSLALLHLMADWAAEGGPLPLAVTVDHALRPESGAEAAAVGRACAARGIAHEVLCWHWDGRGNLQDAARRARQRLIAGWARAQGLGAVALGHTADDQAETVLLRLARGSGVDGLSGMAPRRRALGIDWLRPLLAVRREALRAELTARGAAWAEDPSNEMDRFARTRARQALAALAPLGIGVEGLAATAGRMRMARAALARQAHDAARAIATIDAGGVVFDRAGLEALPEETRLRLVAHALSWVASADYRPRLAALRGALAQALSGRAATLHGCLLMPRRGRLHILREPRAVAGPAGAGTPAWDGRWTVHARNAEGLTIRALGEDGLARCPGWRETGRPRAALLVSPSLWRGEELVAAPHAGLPGGVPIALAQGEEDFFTSLLSH